MSKMFGRIYDAKTDSWKFSDGSGVPVSNMLMPPTNSQGRINGVDLFVYMNDRDRLAQIKGTGGKR